MTPGLGSASGRTFSALLMPQGGAIALVWSNIPTAMLGFDKPTYIKNVLLQGNEAAFGGGVACLGCSVEMEGVRLQSNKAIDPMLSSENVACAAMARRNCSSDTYLHLPGVVEGAGGAIAANFGLTKHVVLKGQSSLHNNSAQWVGGSVYLNHSDCIQNVTKMSVETLPCGLVTSVDPAIWSGTAAMGSTVAWAGTEDDAALCQYARTSGRQHTHPNCSGWVNEQKRVRDPSTKRQYAYKLPQKMSVYDKDCLAGLAHNRDRVAPTNSSQRRSDRDLMDMCSLLDDKRLHSIHSGYPLRIEIRFSDATSKLLELQQQVRSNWMSKAAYSGSCSQRNLSSIALEQIDPGLYIVGPAKASMDVASFEDNAGLSMENLTFQLSLPPRRNMNHSFRLKLQDEGTHAMLRQISPVTVTVTMLRCTMGQFELVSSCVQS